MPTSLTGARLKLQRADKHIQDLDVEIKAFAASEYYALRADFDAKSGQHGIKFDVTKQLPEHLPLVIGDAIHNLRSALDLAVSEIFYQVNGRYSEFIKFPFFKAREKVASAVKGGDIRLTSQAVCDYLVDTVKPYDGGNITLWSLHNLDVLDKHLLLVPTIGSSVVTIITGAENDKNFSILATFFAVKPGEDFIPFVDGKPTQFRVENNFQPTLVVSLGQDLMSRGKDIVPMLRLFLESVSGIVDDLEKICG